MECPHCGKSNEDKTGKSLEVLFCMWCGKDPRATLCTGCKRELSDLPEGILFCPTCGTDLLGVKNLWMRPNVTIEMLRIVRKDPKMLFQRLHGRTGNAIVRSNWTAFGVLTSKDDPLLTIRNFGEKSIEELDEAISIWKNELAKDKL